MPRFFVLALGALFALAAVLACGPASQPYEPAREAPPTASSVAPTSVLVSVANQGIPWDHTAAAVPVTAADPRWGDPLAPVTIVEFSDFECPFCSRVGPALAEVKRTYGPDKVRIVWKNNPLSFHVNARAAADAAQTVFALGGHDAFWKFHDLAFANQRALTKENYSTWARAAGVELARFEQALEWKQFTRKVEEDVVLASRIGATGTPAFRINGVTVSGAQPFEKFKEVIDAALVEAEKLVAAGTSPRDVYVVLTNRHYEEPKPKALANVGVEEDLGVWKIPVFRDDPVRGPNDALVTIVEFSDFQCPFCKRVRTTLDEVLAAYPKDVRLVWKDNPLPFHPRARPTAILARYAFDKRGNKTFWQVHDGLFASHPKLEDADLRRVAEEAGLTWNPIALAIEKNLAPKLEQSMELASDFKARGTPHFFINGVRLSGAQPREAFEERIDEALEVARELVAHGVPRARVYEVIIKDGKLPEPPERKVIPPPDGTTPFRGDPSASVVIQEFSDFQCPFCKRVQPTLAEVEAAFGKKVKLVFRHLPLPFHADAALAAEAAQEAFSQQGNAGFFRFHDALFEAQGTGIGRDVLESIAARLGLDRVRFRAALDARTHRAKVEADARIAEDAGITGTPAFVINGYFVSGAQPTPVFTKLVKRALDDRKKR